MAYRIAFQLRTPHDRTSAYGDVAFFTDASHVNPLEFTDLLEAEQYLASFTQGCEGFNGDRTFVMRNMWDHTFAYPEIRVENRDGFSWASLRVEYVPSTYDDSPCPCEYCYIGETASCAYRYENTRETYYASLSSDQLHAPHLPDADESSGDCDYEDTPETYNACEDGPEDIYVDCLSGLPEDYPF